MKMDIDERAKQIVNKVENYSVHKAISFIIKAIHEARLEAVEFERAACAQIAHDFVTQVVRQSTHPTDQMIVNVCNGIRDKIREESKE